MIKSRASGKRVYLVNRDFQLRYVRMAIVVGLSSTVLTVFLLLYPLFQFGILRFPNFLPAPFVWAMVVAAVLNFLLVATMGILITHRIAGPMYSLVRHIHLVQSGRFKTGLRVRKDDDLKYLVRNFDEMIAALADLARKDRAEVEGIVAKLRQCLEAGRDDERLAAALAQGEALSAVIGQRVEFEADSETEPTKADIA